MSESKVCKSYYIKINSKLSEKNVTCLSYKFNVYDDKVIFFKQKKCSFSNIHENVYREILVVELINERVL